MNVRTFCELWAAWDAAPGHPDRALELEQACARLGMAVGLPATQVRILMSDHRRNGLTRVESVKAILDLREQASA